ncbi:30S ribosomal protein S21 [Acanthopleuribacter pedis]|uniref:Small ribosomal subunit protein bS21 n=1 Tax=Acanthopleuribacter pedis TaxID=442870 RepID=A0A8J7U3I4_9BACT|nr:30S ribosomal protein S21 [Acanthopleuribacter pedis]MBO1319667.1 30S ribosomal protein S21 [Acanthopleuribacter pedis]
MPIVVLQGHESIDEIVKQFKRKCERSGLFSEIKKRKHFIKPSEIRRKEKLEARKKILKKLRKERQRMRYYN